MVFMQFWNEYLLRIFVTVMVHVGALL